MVNRMRNGVSYDFALNWEAIETAENEDPDWDIFSAMSEMVKKPRFTTLYKLSRYIGWDYKEFVRAGFSVEDLGEVLNECLREAGFRSEEQEPVTSSAAGIPGPQI
jgi:hypothetical protein